ARPVHSPLAHRVELRPTHEVFHLSHRPDHRGHDAARTCLQHAHHRRVIRDRHAHKAVDPTAPRRPRRLLDLPYGQPGVFLVEPDRLEAALKRYHLDQLGVTQLPEGEDPNQRMLSQNGPEWGGHAVSDDAISEFDKKSLYRH